MSETMPTGDDDTAIRNLLARLARATDIGAIDEYCDCLTADVVVELPGVPTSHGIEDARAATEAGRIARQVGPPSNTMHLLGQSEITIAGDAADAVTAFEFLRLRNVPPVVHRAGRYYDHLRRTPSGWRVAHRRIDNA